MKQLPAPFIKQMTSLLGEAEAKAFFDSLASESSISVRLNPSKNTLSDEEVSKRLKAVPWASHAFYLPERHPFTFDPAFQAGRYYVQEASSMFIESALKRYLPHNQETISDIFIALDLCAAPGGKSTHLRSLLPDDAWLISNEVIRSRSQILAENMMKWGHPSVCVSNNDPSYFSSMTHLMDLIVADVPCSGEGMFRKDESSIDEWSPAHVNLCVERQRRIIMDVWPSLKPNGLLLYSTCTYNIEENERNVQWICDELGGEALELDMDDSWNISSSLAPELPSLPVARFMPHKTRGEGFFCALIRKQDARVETVNYEALMNKELKKSRKDKGAKGNSKSISYNTSQWLKTSVPYDVISPGTLSLAVSRRHLQLVQYLYHNLKVHFAGIVLGESKGKNFIPHQSLALSPLLDDEAFPNAKVDYKQAIAYLRREAITLGHDVPRGIVLLKYENNAIGFVKNIGNRANNLYPQEWRIRSSYGPETIKKIY